jgi:hypothetical protein
MYMSRCWMIVFMLMSAGPLAAQVPTPTDHLGRPLGGDFTLADWGEVSSYYHKLADQSDRLVVEKLGQTTEGRDFLIGIFSSPQNLANLDAIREYSRIVADPRGTTAAQRAEAIAKGKVILFITNAMHATEAGAPQFGMAFAHQLVTSEAEPYVSARKNMVIVMTPSLNPDGLDRVVHWYRDHVATPHEGTSLTELYQHYAGHDNNRDWFMISLQETKLMTHELYHRWNPQMLWDVHQQGNNAERLFVPPYRDPLNPNLDPVIMAQTNAIGMKAVQDMTAEGLTGIATGITYDQWWIGGNRNVPVRHNVIGVLSEAASVNIASPIFQKKSDLGGVLRGAKYGSSNQYVSPWPGGWWRIGDIIKYELALGRSFLRTLSRDRDVYLRNKMGAAMRVIERGKTSSPRGWVIPADNADIGAARRLIESLMRGGVEARVASGAVIVDGVAYPKGSVVIRADQPNATYVKDLFETKAYPEGAAPYDVSGWTLPSLMGVRRVIAVAELEEESKVVENAQAAVAGFTGAGRAKKSGEWSSRDSDSWTKLITRLKSGKKAWLITDDHSEQRGLIVDQDPNAGDGLSSKSSKSKTRAIEMDRLPRVGVYHPWSGSMDGGWLRWTLDHFGLPFERVHNEQVRAGELSERFDVLIIPSISASSIARGRSIGSVDAQYTGGLGVEGASAIESFVRGGGRLVTLGSSSAWAIENLGLPLVDVTREQEAKDAEFSCPGSVLNAKVNHASSKEVALTAGLNDSLALFFSNSSAYRYWTTEDRKDKLKPGELVSRPQVLLRYAPRNTLLSGYLKGEEIIAGHDAWVRAEIGDGAVHVFGFRPHYRSWTQGTFGLLMRAVLVDQ